MEYKYKYVPTIIHSNNSIKKDMYFVLITLLPAVIFMCYFFGIQALERLILSIVFCVGLEYIILKVFFKNKQSLNIAFDGSAILTGVLLAMNIPSNLPIYLLFLGCFVAIVIGKQMFGGLGCNMFNPAIMARVFLLISFPVAMTTWPSVVGYFGQTDIITTATPLGVLKLEGIKVLGQFSTWDLFWGNIPGSMGEVSAFALIIGGIFLLYKKIITWHIPVSFILTVFIFASFTYLLKDNYVPPLFHVFGGGLMLGAIYMATDYVTGPLTSKGKLIFGIGCGIITMVIRLWGGYPEGVSFSILLMNSLTPLINKYTMTVPFGVKNEV